VDLYARFRDRGRHVDGTACPRRLHAHARHGGSGWLAKPEGRATVRMAIAARTLLESTRDETPGRATAVELAAAGDLLLEHPRLAHRALDNLPAGAQPLDTIG
jgi:hypothetical protein